jgi:hypothetical protein
VIQVLEEAPPFALFGFCSAVVLSAVALLFNDSVVVALLFNEPATSSMTSLSYGDERLKDRDV